MMILCLAQIVLKQTLQIPSETCSLESRISDVINLGNMQFGPVIPILKVIK